MNIKSIAKRIIIGLLLTPILLFVILNFLYPLPSPYQHGVSTLVVDSNGELLRRFANRQGVYREQIELSQVTPFYLDALLNYEDKYFYQHPGINPFSLFRAAQQWMSNGEIISGGSTISMQVARLLTPHSRSISGKFQQMFRALQLELKYSKQEILTLYINLAPFGGNIEGVEAASRKYFNKHASELTKSEAALLVVLPQRPSAYRPDRTPELAKQMRDKVLKRSYQDGLISQHELDFMRQETVSNDTFYPQIIAPLLTRRLRNQYPDQAVIRTTIDGDLQRKLERVFKQTEYHLPDKASMAAVVLRNEDAAVLAYRGSVKFPSTDRAAYVNMVHALRSPGSTLKPFIYGMAFEQGIIHSESLLSDIPTSYHGYKPKNLSGVFHGAVSTRQALQLSLNVPVVQVFRKLTPEHFIARLEALPIKFTYPEPNLSIALGGSGTDLWSLATLYRSLATGGDIKPPYILMDKSLNTNQKQSSAQAMQLLSPEASWMTFDILSDISAPDRVVPESRRKIAWKTGTSYGYRDFWSIGVSADYTVAVWVGRADSTPIIGYLGATQASPIMFDIFDQLPRDKRIIKKPNEVIKETICWPGGQSVALTPTDKCQEVKSAYTYQGITPPSMDSFGLFMTNHQAPTQLTSWQNLHQNKFDQATLPLKIQTLKTGQHFFKGSIEELPLTSNKDNEPVLWYINDHLQTQNIINFNKQSGETKVTACLKSECDQVVIYVH